MDKKDTRRAVKAAVKEFVSVPGQVAAASDAIWSKVEAMHEFANARTVLIYASLPDEVPTAGFIARWADQKRIVLPVVDGEFLRLRLYNPDQLEKGYMDIWEPSALAEEVDADTIELALVPGVAFTGTGARLGRGKGFYDRLLQNLYCPKVGICFPCQIVPELPLDPWDVILDGVIC